MPANEVEIHGSNWKWEDIAEEVKWARDQNWRHEKWVCRAALISKGQIADFAGQKFNSEHTKLVEDGWNHDHCEICWWTLAEDEDPEIGFGYTTDGHTWVCNECHGKLIQNCEETFP